MGTRRVRTQRGVNRYNKPIGALIRRGGRYELDWIKSGRTAGGAVRKVAELDPDTRPVRARQTAGERARALREAVRTVDENYRKFLRGDITRAEKDSISYQSPDLRAKSKRERGTVVRPRSVTLNQVRERRRTVRDVRLNPLSGKYIAVPVSRDTPRGIKGGSVVKARARARKAPTVAPYVGRRRAKD